MTIITGNAPKLYHQAAFEGECRTIASRLLVGHLPVDANWASLGKNRQEHIARHSDRYRLAVGDIDSMPTPPPDELDAEAICLAALHDLNVPAKPPHESDTQILMCLGAMFHNDLHGWDNSLFLNWYLAGPPRDFVVAGVGKVTIRPGDLVLFDPSRPHALLRKGDSRFCKIGWGDSIADRSLFVAWDIALTPELDEMLAIERGSDEALRSQGYVDIE